MVVLAIGVVGTLLQLASWVTGDAESVPLGAFALLTLAWSQFVTVRAHRRNRLVGSGELVIVVVLCGLTCALSVVAWVGGDWLDKGLAVTFAVSAAGVSAVTFLARREKRRGTTGRQS